MEIAYIGLKSMVDLLQHSIMPATFAEDVSFLVEEVKEGSLPSTQDTLKAFFRAEGFMSAALVCVPEPRIIGMATVVRVVKVNGFTLRLEHVGVRKDFQGRGIGKKLVQLAQEEAFKIQGRYMDLTSEPSRVSANILYEKLGFERRDTNVWRWVVTSQPVTL